MKSSEYWAERVASIANDQEVKADEYVKLVEAQYAKAMARTQTDIESFYLKYAEAKGISLAATKKHLTNAEKLTWEVTLDQYREMALDGSFEKELDAMYSRSRVSRFQAINIQVKTNIEALHKNILDGTTDLLEDTLKDTYYKTIYEIQKGTKLGINFGVYNQDAVDAVLAKQWKYGNFSSNLWEDKEKLLDELETNLTQAFIRGDSVDKTVKTFSERMRVDKYRASRIIQTESAYIAGQATAKSYESQGIEYYEYLATLDTHTSELCRGMDGKVIKLTQKEVGVNYPPLHSFCRSTTIPYFDDEYDEDEQRISRSEDGNTYYVDGDMDYQSWYNEYVESPEVAKAKQDIKDIGFTGTISIPAKSVDTDILTFDSDHINKSRQRSITRDEAVGFIEAAQISIGRWNGQFENYYSPKGVAYINTKKNEIRTAYSIDEFDDKIKELLEVMSSYEQ